MLRRSMFFLEVGGTLITDVVNPLLTSISIKLTAQSKGDTCDVDLNDQGGQISLPPTGAPLRAGIGWDFAPQMFEGKVHKVTSTGSRGGGRMLSIQAQSIARDGKGKERKEKHKDKAKLADVAKEWGSDAGLQVQVHESLASIERDYWYMANQTFMAWAAKIGRELGATVKIIGDRAIILPRSAGVSVSGKQLATIHATSDKIINWSISPAGQEPQFQKFKVRTYNKQTAKFETEEAEASFETSGVSSERVSRFMAPDKAQAKQRAQSNEKDSDRERGGGTVDMDGEPLGMPEADFILSGTRPGIDGTYRVEEVTHKKTRDGGFTSSFTIKQPKGEAGKDKRKPTSGAKSSSGGSSTPPGGLAGGGTGNVPALT